MPDDSRPASREPWREAFIEAIWPLTPTVKAVRLRPSLWRPFVAGQHVDVRLTAPDGYTAQRSYSVTSSPGEHGIIELAIERLVEGEVSPYFHDVAQPGDTVELRGPFTEHFVWRPTDAAAVLLVAGGSGVAPFLSMIRQRAEASAVAPMTLLYSARTWDDVIYRDELVAQEQSQERLLVRFALTREPARRDGDFGRRVDTTMLEAIIRASAAPALAYVCGRNAFVEGVAGDLVALGVAASAIRTERYGG